MIYCFVLANPRDEVVAYEQRPSIRIGSDYYACLRRVPPTRAAYKSCVASPSFSSFLFDLDAHHRRSQRVFLALAAAAPATRSRYQSNFRQTKHHPLLIDTT